MGTNEKTTNTLTFNDYVDIILSVTYTKAVTENAQIGYYPTPWFKQQRVQELDELLRKLRLARDISKGAQK